MTAPDLKPCPFCGGEAHEGFDGGYRVMKCDRCPVEVYAESRKRLVKVWNARATPAPSAMRPEVAKLVEAANMALDLGSLMDSPPDREFQVPRRCYLALDAALVALRAKGDA